jgi:hypothetical protein
MRLTKCTLSANGSARLEAWPETRGFIATTKPGSLRLADGLVLRASPAHPRFCLSSRRVRLVCWYKGMGVTSLAASPNGHLSRLVLAGWRWCRPAEDPLRVACDSPRSPPLLAHHHFMPVLGANPRDWRWLAVGERVERGRRRGEDARAANAGDPGVAGALLRSQTATRNPSHCLKCSQRVEARSVHGSVRNELPRLAIQATARARARKTPA